METNNDRPQPIQLTAATKLKTLRDAAWVTNQASAFAYFMAADLYDDSGSMAKVYQTLREVREAASKAWKLLQEEAANASDDEEEKKDCVDSIKF